MTSTPSSRTPHHAEPLLAGQVAVAVLDVDSPELAGRLVDRQGPPEEQPVSLPDLESITVDDEPVALQVGGRLPLAPCRGDDPRALDRLVDRVRVRSQERQG